MREDDCHENHFLLMPIACDWSFKKESAFTV